MKLILSALLGVCLATAAAGQDLHFSQFINSPLSTNPANTGFIPDGDYRLGINYRNQWSSVMTVPYKTMSVYADAQLMRDRFETGWVGVGGLLMRDVAGSGNLTSTKVYGSVAYHQMLGYSSLLSVGFNVGYASKQINTTNLKFPDQFDGKFFDNKLPTGVQLSRNNVGYLDLQAGMNYAYFPTEKIYVNAGFSTHHINRPQETFFQEDPLEDAGVPMRHIGFLNGSFMLNEEWILNPNLYYTRQAGGSELVGGANVNYNLSGDGTYTLIGGLYYRYKEAVIPMLGLGMRDYVATFTYDATASSLSAYNGGRGAFELSIVRQGIMNSFNGDRRQTICPSFKTY